MRAKSSRQELVPSAKRLVGSLRDIGYDLSSAVADLIDNSIAAGATSVHVDMQFSGEDSWIRVADNGSGMSETRLIEAMRFGTRREYKPNDLGKFGLGLKSASLSQCKRITVATRTAVSGPIRIAQWDLDHVQTTDRWEIRRPGVRGVRPEVVTPLRERRGTVVFWERLDRIFRYRVHDGQRASDGFADAAREVQGHLEMLFHRFLEGSARRRRRLSIYLNSRKLVPWDPYARNEPQTYRLPAQALRLERDGRTHTLAVQPFVLPSEAAFSSSVAHRRAAGPKKWNAQQGFYFYRNDRMIQSGGWNRLRAPDEHVKLARISIDFPVALDSEFELNVSKTQVRVPTSVRSELSALASSVALVAQNAYRRPSQGYGAMPASLEDPRMSAVNDLVEMIVAGVRGLIEEELGAEPLLRERLLSRINEMQRQLAREMHVAIASNGHVREGPRGAETLELEATTAG